ncbi:alpha/beta hydrolase family protein [Arenibacterium sp. LLYu02]|uniref:alpha/beta hydrolase family protein n=1 Tax=Arenibacterium sp. LLYu02 TaxID=3404132 RepID=UPI003B20E27D
MKRFAFLLSLALSQAVCQAVPAAAEMLPGYDRFDLSAAHRARPIAASIWYPAANPTYRAPIGDGPIFDPTFAFVGPAVAEGAHPLVLLSHGSGGNADSLGWLTSGLVAQGAIVLAVNHQGSTSGDSSPRRSVDLQARAQDLSAALDLVLADPAFAPFVDPEQIGVVGFSLGGATALGLAGVRFEGAVQDENCTNGPEAADCVFFRLGGVRFADYPGYDADMRDPRITRAAIIDPGFGGSARPDSLPEALAGITLINLGGADRLKAADVAAQGNNLAQSLPDASYVEIAPANHFTFLATCKPGAAEMLAAEREDPICSDPEGADRAEVHGALIEAIAAGLKLPGRGGL